MKKTILIILIVAVLGFLVWYGRKFVLLKNRVQVQGASIQIDPKDLLSFNTIRNIPFKAVFTVSNYSNDKQTISQMFVELFDENENLIAKQSEPLQNKIILEANKNTEVSVKSQISTNLFLQIAGATSVGDLAVVATGGTLGIKVVARGFAVVNGVKIPFTQETEI